MRKIVGLVVTAVFMTTGISATAAELTEAQAKDLAAKAGPWLQTAKAGATSDFEVGGTKLHASIVVAEKDVDGKEKRLLSLDGADKSHYCQMFKLDGSEWKNPGSAYKASC